CPEKGKKSRQKKKCKQFRIDTSSLNRKNHITLSDAIKFDLICVSLEQMQRIMLEQQKDLAELKGTLKALVALRS
ncbi:MAG: hypothetical protein ING27_04590, partial [Burkholderiales bacterium]|nr:hypothetical protein [Burkholderiales bacterium]